MKFCFLWWFQNLIGWRIDVWVQFLKHIQMMSCIPFASTSLCIFLIYFIFKLYKLYQFCQISKWIHHRYTCVTHPEPSSLPPPHVHEPQASSIVHWTWTGISFHTWYYTCFNAILPNLPTLSLSNRVLKTDPYISVSFAVSYTGLLLPSF